MLSQLLQQVLTLLEGAPLPLLYFSEALWIGLDAAGLPLPVEPVLLFTGALAAEGKTGFVVAVAVAAVGALAFASLAYAVGRRVSLARLVRVGSHAGLTQQRADLVEGWLRKRGMLGIVVASVAPLLRTYSGYLMGIARIPRHVFALGVILGATLYSTLWLVVGMVMGSHYRAVLGMVDQIGLAGGVLLVGGGVALIFVHRKWCRLCLRLVGSRVATKEDLERQGKDR